jgi:hypothetical protein
MTEVAGPSPNDPPLWVIMRSAYDNIEGFDDEEGYKAEIGALIDARIPHEPEPVGLDLELPENWKIIGRWEALQELRNRLIEDTL